MNAYHKLAQEKQAELNRLLVERATEYSGEFPPDLKPMLEEIGTLLALGNYADMLERLHAIVKDQAWYKPVIGDSVVTSVENIIAAFQSAIASILVTAGEWHSVEDCKGEGYFDQCALCQALERAKRLLTF